MRFVIAFISLGLFSWLSYAVYFGTINFSDGGGSSKTRALKAAVSRAIETYGAETTALALLGVGAALAFGFIAFGPREDVA